MRRVLIVSPHFPPDASAGTHRARLLASRLPEFDWSPTILTVRPEFYESRLDSELLATVPSSVPTVRVPALSAGWTRYAGVGDLGLRALPALYRCCRRLLAEERFDCLFVTIFPAYPALLGRLLRRGRDRTSGSGSDLPFVLDYQDPWVGAWGLETGPGGAAPNFKSRLSRALATKLEPYAVSAASGLSAVSSATYESVLDRNPSIRGIPCSEIPIGGSARDFEHLASSPRQNPCFAPGDGKIHLVYVGTILPMGIDVLRAFLRALVLLKERVPSAFARVRVHFVGTSNQSEGESAENLRVVPEARQLGIENAVSEMPARLDYFDALNVLAQSSAILVLGSTEKHYTASKLFPALLARRPLLSAFHADSPAVSLLRRAARPPTARLVTFDDEHPPLSRVESFFDELRGLVEEPVYRSEDTDESVLEEFSDRAMAGRFAALFSQVAAR